MDDIESIGVDYDGGVKNLFLSDKPKRRFFLVTVLGDKKINLESLQDKLDVGRLSFVSCERLETMLGVKSGSVSPLGVINDMENKIEVIFDTCMKNHEKVGIHPNDNTATIWLKPNDLERVIREIGNPLQYIDL
jgi:Ala-tRNA(Pro) deacylase